MSEIEEEIFRAFETPQSPPQLESEASAELMDLFFKAPDWDPEVLGVELVHVFRNHVAVRSMLRYALVMAKHAEIRLRGAESRKDIFRLQGELTGLTTFVNNVMKHLEEAEKPKETVQ